MRKISCYSILIAAVMIANANANANTVTVHKEKFQNLPAGSGEHFYGRLMDWKLWSQSPEQKVIQMPYNYVALATEDSGPSSLSGSGFNDLKFLNIKEEDSAEEIDEFINYYNERDMEYPEYYRTPGGAVFDSKVQIDLPDDFDINAVNLNNISEVILKADHPHMHSPVSRGWVSNFLPNFHAAHDIVKIDDDAKYSLIVVNTGRKYYRCEFLDTALLAQSAGLGLAAFGSYRQYMVNRLTALDPTSVDVRVLETGAEKVFQQQIIYSSNLIKAGESLIGFYKNAETGKKKLVITNSIVMTSKVLSIFTDKFVNGFTANNTESVKMNEAKTLGKLTQENTDIRPSNSEACGEGLGLGVASYIYNLATKVVKGLNERTK